MFLVFRTAFMASLHWWNKKLWPNIKWYAPATTKMQFWGRGHIFYYNFQIFVLTLAYLWYKIYWIVWRPPAADTQTIAVAMTFSQYEITKTFYKQQFLCKLSKIKRFELLIHSYQYIVSFRLFIYIFRLQWHNVYWLILSMKTPFALHAALCDANLRPISTHYLDSDSKLYIS